MTSRWIELTWQPPSNADSLGSDLLGYRVYVEELCDHRTSHQYRRLLRNSGLLKESEFESEAGMRPGQCREVSPETVKGATSLTASFHNLGNYIYYSGTASTLNDF